MPARYAYLGPSGTFSEAALRTVPEAADAELVPAATVVEALEAVRAGDVDLACVPLENSVEGSVATTLDELATGAPLQVVREVLLPVRFALLARPGTALADVGHVATHPHAEAQCRGWLRCALPHVVVVPAASTAAAAAAVAHGGPEAPDAAVASHLAGERHNLVVLADDVADADGAVTRFVLVRQPGPPPPATGADRTTVVAFISDDHPGALLELLTEFSVRGVNLTRLESRPTGRGLGRYWFSLDAEGHVADARVGEALAGLHRLCTDVRVLGSYPRADGTTAEPIRAGTADEDFAAADAWLSVVRTGG